MDSRSLTHFVSDQVSLFIQVYMIKFIKTTKYVFFMFTLTEINVSGVGERQNRVKSISTSIEFSHQSSIHQRLHLYIKILYNLYIPPLSLGIFEIHKMLCALRTQNGLWKFRLIKFISKITKNKLSLNPFPHPWQNFSITPLEQFLDLRLCIKLKKDLLK